MKYTTNNKKSGISITNEGFNFLNYACDVITDTIHNKYGEGIQLINIKNKREKEIHFVFKDSLYNKNDSASSNNILIQFISINTNDISSLENFIKKNGFIFNNSFNEYIRYNYSDLKRVIKRVTYLVNLIKELQNDSPNIENLFRNAMYLLLTNPIEILDNNKSIIYKSMDYTMYSILEKYNKLVECANNYKHPGYTEAAEEYNESKKEVNDIFKFNIIYTYYNCGVPMLKENIPDIFKLQINFLYSMVEKKLIVIKNINNEIILEFPHNFQDIISGFDEKLKDNLIKISKNIVKSELEYNIGNIKPNYDIDSLLGAWHIPNLLSAIYFSIFFLNPKFEIIKKCFNPTCSAYFSVLHSNTKKKYCSEGCANAVNQRNTRLRKKHNHQV